MKKYKVKEGAYVKTEATRLTLVIYLMDELNAAHNAEAERFNNGEITEAQFRAYQKGTFKDQFEAIRALDIKAQIESHASSFHRDNGASLADIVEEVNGD